MIYKFYFFYVLIKTSVVIITFLVIRFIQVLYILIKPLKTVYNKT